MRARMNQAIAAALADEMELDPHVILMGEDVAVAGGAFKTSEGLLERFGPLRVRDTPIAEMGFTGAGVGAAATGLRPVVEIMFVEFLGVALDQLVTQAAKFPFLSGGQLTLPLTVRASTGVGLGFGTQHGQTLEHWFMATPGLKTVVASGVQAAYDLVRSAIRDDGPVVVLEPRVLYGIREELQRGDSRVRPLGRADIVQRGTDVTIVALGQTVRAAESAAAAAGWSANIIDLRTLVPWDEATVLESVSRTGRLVTVEESPLHGGWGTDVVAKVAAEAFRDLTAPPLRVTTPDVPVPYGRELEERFLPSPSYVEQQVTELVTTGKLPRPWWEQVGVA